MFDCRDKACRDPTIADVLRQSIDAACHSS
jgi:hypothetical protein